MELKLAPGFGVYVLGCLGFSALRFGVKAFCSGRGARRCGKVVLVVVVVVVMVLYVSLFGNLRWHKLQGPPFTNLSTRKNRVCTVGLQAIPLCCAWGCGCVEVCGDDSRVDAAIAMAQEARGFAEFGF